MILLFIEIINLKMKSGNKKKNDHKQDRELAITSVVITKTNLTHIYLFIQ
jgi:hypothetical protein